MEGKIFGEMESISSVRLRWEEEIHAENNNIKQINLNKTNKRERRNAFFEI
jgi:hypothetical protein